MLILSSLASLSYADEKSIEEKYDGYTILIKPDDPECDGLLCPRTLSVEKNHKKLFEVESAIIGTTYYNSTANFLSNTI